MSRGGTTFGCCKKHGDYCGSSCPFCQITELKDVLEGLMSGLLKEQTKRKNLEEVLRDFLWALDDYFESKNQKKFQKIFRKLHKKLDSGLSEQTKKKLDSEPSFICKKCGEGVYINNYKFKGSYYCVDCMPEGKTMEIPDTINFNGVIYGKIEEFLENLKIAHNKLNNVIIERELSHYLINLIEEYKGKLSE